MGILEAVLAELGEPASVEAELAVRLAGVLDDPATPSQALAANALRLLDTMQLIRSAESGLVNPLDEIRARRDAKVGRSGSPGGVGSAGAASS